MRAVKYRKEHGIPVNKITFRPKGTYLIDDEHGYVTMSEFYPFSDEHHSPSEQLAHRRSSTCPWGGT